LLRKGGVKKNFFSNSKKVLHFDLSKLSNELKWKLKMYAELAAKNS